jgi:toxin YoeB
MRWAIYYTKQAQKDAQKASAAGLKPQIERLLALLENDPFATNPRYEKLIGDLSGAYSRRINIKHRLVYQVFLKEHAVKVLRMWTHYDE